MSTNVDRSMGSSNVGQMMEGASELEANSFRKSAKGMACAWEYDWEEVGVPGGKGYRRPDRSMLKRHDKILNTVAGTNLYSGAPPKQGPSSSSNFKDGVEGMTYVDVPTIPGLSSRGSSLASASPGDSRNRQMHGEGGNVNRGGFAVNMPSSSTGSTNQRGMDGSSGR